jgi:hypothetical protein
METTPKNVNGLDELKEALKGNPMHIPIEIPKDTLSHLPDEFERTKLGYSKEGELAQYRGPENMHMHEFPDRFEVHKDYFDPRTIEGAIGHAFADAPEIGFGITAGLSGGIGVGKLVYELRKDKSENAAVEAKIAGSLAAFGFGLLTFVIIRCLGKR